MAIASCTGQRHRADTAPLQDNFERLPDAGLLTLTIAVSVKPTSRWRRPLPILRVRLGAQSPQFTLLPDSSTQSVTLAIDHDDLALPLELAARNADIGSTLALSLSATPPVTNDAIMVISPYPQDAPLGAGGLCLMHSDRIHVVTLSSGAALSARASLPAVVPTADVTADQARHLHEWLYSWNAMAWPLLADIPPQRCAMLGMSSVSEPGPCDDHPPASGGRDWPADDTTLARRLNPFTLPGDHDDSSAGHWPVDDLIALLERWRPATVLVTDPEFDPRHDRYAAACLLARALERSAHQPGGVLLYATAFKDGAHPPGGAFQPAWTPPAALRRALFAAPQSVLYPLTPTTQREKAQLLQAVSGLDGRYSPRQQDRQAGFRATFARGRDPRFQQNVRSSEWFQWVDVSDFVQAIQQADHGAQTSAVP